MLQRSKALFKEENNYFSHRGQSSRGSTVMQKLVLAELD